ncbi:MAG: phosphoribosylformylglycinamidine synthase subunit PurQ / glutaminase [Candidatus Parcubacteria bacterium]|jgi:phosphoribosylformylglycinamidine synthase|nr:phosphoribosylformylglycinamidine synthase subunit PurQ / glutaminase [Candidatus Parcubacteria bacterium]
MAAPRILIFSGYGLNCEEETAAAFELAGGRAEIVHVNDLIDGGKKMKNYQILAFPGGFSYGDDTGSGKAYANKVRNHLEDDLQRFVDHGGLVIGICNGFQILTNLGLLPGALTFNKGARYIDRWVDIEIEGRSPWLSGIKRISLPIAHGEGKFVLEAEELDELRSKGQIAARYVKGEICRYHDLEANPNGSLEDIAGITAQEGRILGLMPHPERALWTSMSPDYQFLKEKSGRQGKKLAKIGPGLNIFQNAIKFSQKS